MVRCCASAPRGSGATEHYAASANIHLTMTATGDYHNSRLSASHAYIVEGPIKETLAGNHATIDQWAKSAETHLKVEIVCGDYLGGPKARFSTRHAYTL